MAQLTFWDMISPTVQEALVDAGRVQTLRAGQTLMTQGDRGDRVVIVMEGWIKLCIVSDYGTETVLDLLGPGHIIGEMDVLDGQARIASAVAKHMSKVLSVSGSRFRDILERHPETLHPLLRVAWTRLADAYELRVSSRGARARVIALVHQLANRYGTAEPGGDIAITPPLSREEFASWAGTSRRSAVNALNWLSTKGAIQPRQRKTIVIWRELRRVLRDLGQDHDEDERTESPRPRRKLF